MSDSSLKYWLSLPVVQKTDPAYCGTVSSSQVPRTESRYINTLPDFRYEPLGNANKQIRLLQVTSGNGGARNCPCKQAHLSQDSQCTGHPVRCVLTTWNVQDAPPYTAISYVWGDDCTYDHIVVGDCKLVVRRNAYSTILKVDRQVKGNWLWIDSVCINQSDDKEKTDQVRIMGHIYSHARAVISYVGDHTSDSRLLSEALRTQREATQSSKAKITPGIGAALVSFSQRVYWTRLWIIQECIAAQRLYLLCGEEIMAFTGLERLVLDMESTSKSEMSGSFRRTHLWEILQSKVQSDPQLEFEAAIKRYGRWSCKDLRDRIFGLLYLIKWTENGYEPLTPNYSWSTERLAVKAFPHCPTLAGMRTTCELLDIDISEADGLVKAAFRGCSNLCEVHYIKERLEVRSIQDIDTARSILKLCSTRDEVFAALKWLSGAAKTEDERVQLMRDIKPLCPDMYITEMQRIFGIETINDIGVARVAMRACSTREEALNVCGRLSSDLGQIERLQLMRIATSLWSTPGDIQEVFCIQATDCLEAAMAAMKLCSTRKETLSVYAWLSDDLTQNERFQLMQISMPLWLNH